jgi:hypothetical protein
VRAFGVVLCQQGLQFFPAKASWVAGDAPCAETGRKDRSPRLGTNGRSPGFAVLAEALTRHVNTQAGDDDAPRRRHDRSHDVFDNYDSESALSQSADQRDGLRSTRKDLPIF